MLKKIIIVLSFVIVIGGLSYLYQTVPMKTEIRTVTMIDNEGNETGTVQLSETKAGVLLTIKLQGLEPNGEHAFHIHEKGDCSPLNSFKNAGGHYNPHSKHHGMQHPEGHHAGDMPNLKPDDEGHIIAKVLNRSVTLNSETTKDGRETVFDADGSSLMIHADADDHVSQPSGAAGSRIMCGEIK